MVIEVDAGGREEGVGPNLLRPEFVEALNTRRTRVTSAPRKYPDEVRQRATQMAVELRQDPATKMGAFARVADQWGLHRETLRSWVRQPEIDGGMRAG